MWVSSWLGSVKNVFEKVIGLIRSSSNSSKFKSDVLYHRLSNTRTMIDMVSIYLEDTIRKYEYHSSNKEFLKSNEFQIQLNNLKIYSSENLFKAVNELVDLVGMQYGYLKIKIFLWRELLEICVQRLLCTIMID